KEGNEFGDTKIKAGTAGKSASRCQYMIGIKQKGAGGYREKNRKMQIANGKSRIGHLQFAFSLLPPWEHRQSLPVCSHNTRLGDLDALEGHLERVRVGRDFQSSGPIHVAPFDQLAQAFVEIEHAFQETDTNCI